MCSERLLNNAIHQYEPTLQLVNKMRKLRSGSSQHVVDSHHIKYGQIICDIPPGSSLSYGVPFSMGIPLKICKPIIKTASVSINANDWFGALAAQLELEADGEERLALGAVVSHP